MKVRLKDIAQGYRFRGALLRALMPRASRSWFLFLSFIHKFYLAPWRDKHIQRDIFYIKRDDGRAMRCFLYHPCKPSKTTMAGMLYLHGGGYGMGSGSDISTYARLFTKKRDTVLLSIDYTLSIDRPFPAALEDSLLALHYLFDHAEELHIDPRKIFLAGESAGGGLAIGLSLYCRDHHEADIAGIFALYPMLDYHVTDSSRDNNAPVWNAKSNQNAWNLYLGEMDRDAISPYASPSYALDLQGLPPLVSYVGSLDPFLDEDLSYFKKLEEAGVEVHYRVYSGCFHAFDTVKLNHPYSKEALAFLEERFEHAKAHHCFKGD